MLVGAITVIIIIACEGNDEVVEPICADNANCLAPDQIVCGIELPSYIDIVVQNIDEGIRSFDAFRLNESGLLSHASWELSLMSLGSVSLGSDVYRNTVDALSELSLDFPPDDGTQSQPGGSDYQVSFVSPDSVDAQTGSLGAEELLPILDGWRAETTLNSVNGNFYRTTLIGGSVTEDIDIDTIGCEDPISRALVDGITGEEVLLPASEFFTTSFGSSTGRPNVIASTPVGRVIFGVVPFE